MNLAPPPRRRIPNPLPLAFARAVAVLCLAAAAAAPATRSAAAPAEPPPPAVLTLDFDQDGVPERLLSRPGSDEIQRRTADGRGWEKADFTLPDGVTRLDAAGHDAGLRFVDLNGDGFADVLFSNPDRFGLHLWSTQVKPHLGWTRGWSQFVRAGTRTGAPGEPPSLAEADVRVEGDSLVIVRRNPNGEALPVERQSLRALIAFDIPPPKSPDQALAAFRVRPGFRVETVATEPVVLDPIAFDWGADGRLWVVEMRDYPQGLDGRGQPGGVVKILDDSDGDGRYEKATVFLDGIPFPTSVMPWRGGALIAAAPDLFYAEDTDGDGRADLRRVLFTGFAPGNQQHRFNGFEWGLDGWIHAANGDSGGTVTSLATGASLSISGRDIRFRPDTGEVETVSAQTQYGRRRDDWGNWFGNNNPTWLWHVTVPEHYLRRNPRVAAKRVLHVLANYPDSTRVFPASPPVVRPNQPWSLNHVTSACSPCPYRDNLFGDDFASSVLICEPVHNAIHREVLTPEGPGFVSRRAPDETESEFLASTDPWFRPTTARTGPDGALYLADMYRFVIEHPEWISPEMQARLDLRAGSDRGRLYRVVPEGRPRRAIPNLAALDPLRWVAALDSPNGWQRDMAQRLILQRGDRSVAAPLTALLSVSHPPQVRLQALATLGLLGALPPIPLQNALRDPHPAVRAEALRQSEAFALSPPHDPATGAGAGARAKADADANAVFGAVAALAADRDAAVRLQAAFSLGAWPPDRAEPVLAELAARDGGDPLFRTAILSSLRPASPLFAQWSRTDAQPPPAPVAPIVRPSSPDRAAVIAGFAGLDALPGDPTRGRTLFQTLCAPCHRLRDDGHEVGPDLAMVGAKPTEWLLAAILDPGQAVDARYQAWTISLKSGDILDGLIAAETANNIVLRLSGGTEHAILRDTIEALAPLKTSLMPDGFETAMKPQDMADLLRWLRGP